MTRIGTVELGTVPRIAVPVTDADLRKGLSNPGDVADLLELRIDQFADREPGAVERSCEDAARTGIPLIATVRAANEGGGPGLSEDRRLDLFRAAAPHVDAIDIELSSEIHPEVRAIAGEHDCALIVSHHDFARTPPNDDLRTLVDRARGAGADIVKIATTAAGAGDTARLLDLLRAHRGRDMIVIAMGDHGAASRVFFPLVGSVITYGFAGRANAPGQLSALDLAAELRRYSPEYRAARGLADR